MASSATMISARGKRMPVWYWNTATTVQTVMTAVTTAPNLSKPFIMASGLNHSPMAIRTAMIVTGIMF